MKKNKVRCAICGRTKERILEHNGIPMMFRFRATITNTEDLRRIDICQGCLQDIKDILKGYEDEI